MKRAEQVAFMEGVIWANQYRGAPEKMGEEADKEAKRLYPDFDPLPSAMKKGQSSGF